MKEIVDISKNEIVEYIIEEPNDNLVFFKSIPIDYLDNKIVAEAYADSIKRYIDIQNELLIMNSKMKYIIIFERYFLSLMGSLGLGLIAKYLTEIILSPMIYVLSISISSPFYIIDNIVGLLNSVFLYINEYELIDNTNIGYTIRKYTDYSLENIGNKSPVIFVFIISFFSIFVFMKLLEKMQRLREINMIGIHIKFD